MTAFGEYASWYDLFYRDKDYDGEVRYVQRLLAGHGVDRGDLLELGCGTGRHAVHLVSQGWNVTGIDLSEQMVGFARERLASASGSTAGTAHFAVGDARNFYFDRHFDAAVALFHVMSYQPDAEALLAVLTRVREQLVAGGVFVFDFWYGPAVLHQRPEHRTRKVRGEGLSVTRHATPRLVEPDRVEVRYDFDVVLDATSETQHVTEYHTMRFLFAPDIREAARQAGFARVELSGWLTDEPLSVHTWNGCAVLQR